MKLHPAWIVADAGEVVDPGGLTAQLEGGLIQAASWTLYEQVTWNGGGITSRDWETYPVIRFDNIPAVETVLMERPGQPFLGAGEARSQPRPTGGTIANAICRATGLRLRRMPFDATRSARRRCSKPRPGPADSRLLGDVRQGMDVCVLISAIRCEADCAGSPGNVPF